MADTRRSMVYAVTALLALIAVVVSVIQLERAREGVAITDIAIGTTPASLYDTEGASGPLVVVAHGFAGSRQMMEALSLTLARAGYRVLAFDFEGHGRHPVPMSGDVGAIDGTTARLVAQTRDVIAAGRLIVGDDVPVALAGHSMATDIIVRAADAEPGIDTVIAISLFSEAVTARQPENLLIVSGEWEARLRAVALDAVRLLDPQAREDETVAAPGMMRRAVVAPYVEHVGVLYSPTMLEAARNWLDLIYDRQSITPVAATGPWIMLLLGAVVILFRPICALIPQTAGATVAEPGTRRFVVATFVPMLAAPLIAHALHLRFLPVLVADYLMLHLAVFGIIQLVVLGWGRGWVRPAFGRVQAMCVALLVVWGIAVFGLFLDRYAASFMPTAQRLLIIGVLALGTVPFMVADAFATGGGRGRLWRRVLSRVAVLVSLMLAALSDPQELGFILIIFPVLVLFFAVYGSMGRWLAQRAGALAAGLGLGIVLAWSLGVSFPLFS